MESGQYTGKSDATQGEGPPPGAPPRAPVGAGAPRARRPGRRPGGNAMRLLTWGAVLAVLLGGLALYFRYEPTVVPFFGRGR
jgi:hypothetical protein